MTDPMMARVLVVDEELLAVEIQSRGPLMGAGQSGEGTKKGLLTTEVETVENTNKSRLQDTRKVE